MGACLIENVLVKGVTYGLWLDCVVGQHSKAHAHLAHILDVDHHHTDNTHIRWAATVLMNTSQRDGDRGRYGMDCDFVEGKVSLPSNHTHCTRILVHTGCVLLRYSWGNSSCHGWVVMSGGMGAYAGDDVVVVMVVTNIFLVTTLKLAPQEVVRVGCISQICCNVLWLLYMWHGARKRR